MRLTAQQGQTDVVQLRWREEAIGEGHPVPNNGNCIEGQLKPIWQNRYGHTKDKNTTWVTAN